ncbi:TPA: DsbC family protein [Vibrio vulnificus]|nr:DsbC family protein [Vibrio vulnificus]HAS6231028.1 hypothetical protein [Vibrio vulnificus]HDY7776784.1 DsbC family protein [Vibrio vulnificus]
MIIQTKHIAVLQFLALFVLLGLHVKLSDITSMQPDSSITETVDMETIRKTIQTSMPNTPIRSVMPAPIEGLYEVTSNSGLLYTDKEGRYLFVGGIYDPKTNTDIVQQRKQELGFKEPSEAQNKQRAERADSNNRGAGPYPLSLSTLDSVKDYAITYREIPGAPVVYELFDPMCGHCRNNHRNLDAINVTIKKLLVVSVGSADINKQVYCAVDPKAAIDSLMSRNAIVSDGRSRANCDVSDLDKIKDWMNANGIPGLTPQTILADKQQLWRGEAPSSVWNQRLGL